MTDRPTTFSKVLLEKLITAQLVMRFPAFSGTLRFITVSKKSLPNPKPVDNFHPISLRSSLILSSRLRLGLPSCFSPSCFTMKMSEILKGRELLEDLDADGRITLSFNHLIVEEKGKMVSTI